MRRILTGTLLVLLLATFAAASQSRSTRTIAPPEDPIYVKPACVTMMRPGPVIGEFEGRACLSQQLCNLWGRESFVPGTVYVNYDYADGGGCIISGQRQDGSHYLGMSYRSCVGSVCQ
jgi:hypothetical protein